MSATRQRRKHTLSMTERLQQFGSEARDAGRQLPAGTAKNELMEKIRNSEEAVRMCGWLDSKELTPHVSRPNPGRLPPDRAGHLLMTLTTPGPPRGSGGLVAGPWHAIRRDPFSFWSRRRLDGRFGLLRRRCQVRVRQQG